VAYKPLALPERLGAVPIDRAMALVEKNFDAIFQWTQQTVDAVGASSVPATVQGDLLVGTAAGLAVLGKDASKISYLSNAGAGSQPQWSSLNQGDILVGNAAGLINLAKDTNATRYLANTGTSNQPKWDLINLANGVTGKLPALANLPDFSVTQRLWGRNTAGSGVAEEVTILQVLDWISATRGTILYRGASTWAALAPAAGGLTSGGAGTDPVWSSVALGGGNIQAGAGTPQGAISAALGTVYEDTATGYLYIKLGGGSTAFGWYRVCPGGAGNFAGMLTWSATPTPLAAANFTRATSYGFLAADATLSNTFSSAGVTSTAFVTLNSKRYTVGTEAATSGTVMSLTTGAPTATLSMLDDDFDLVAELITGTSVAAMRFWFGITSDSTFNTDTLASASTGGGILFRFSTVAGDGGFVGYTAAGGGGATHVSATVNTIVASTAYKLRIRFVRQGTPTAFFSVNDGTEVAMTANLPATGAVYLIGLAIVTQANVAKSIGWRSFGAVMGS
jgi:hypothetical protein